jgi:MinD superfamily P-loop ATPase
VIASLTGAHLVLAVTEPTVSGRHDLDRVLQVVRQFRLPFAVVLNKADLNPELTGIITGEARGAGALFVQEVEYDPAVTSAQVAGVDVVTYGGRAAAAIESIWNEVARTLATEQEGDVSHA